MPINTGAWTSLLNVKVHLGLITYGTDQDDFLTSLINASQLICEKYIKHPIKQATYIEYYDGDGTRSLILRKFPVISVTSVHVDVERDFGADELSDSGDYYVDLENGIIEFYKSEGSGPTMFETGTKNIKVVYSAGYASIPEDLVQAANEHVAWMFRRADTEGTVAQSLGGKSEQYDESMMPAWLRLKLLAHKERAV